MILTYILWVVMSAAWLVALYVGFLWIAGEREMVQWVEDRERALQAAQAVNESRGLADVLDRQGKVIDRTYVRKLRD
jgi:hypothetical protein